MKSYILSLSLIIGLCANVSALDTEFNAGSDVDKQYVSDTTSSITGVSIILPLPTDATNYLHNYTTGTLYDLEYSTVDANEFHYGVPTASGSFSAGDLGYGLGVTINRRSYADNVQLIGAMTDTTPTYYITGNNTGGASTPLLNIISWGSGGIAAGTSYIRMGVTHSNGVSNILTDGELLNFYIGEDIQRYPEFSHDASNNVTLRINDSNLMIMTDGGEVHIDTSTLFVSSMTAYGTITSSTGFIGGNSTFTRICVDSVYHAFGSTWGETIEVPLTQNVWQTITGGGENGLGNLWTNFEADGFSFAGDTMTIVNAGDYGGDVSITGYATTGNDFLFKIKNLTTDTTVQIMDGATTLGENNNTNTSFSVYLENVAAGNEFVLQVMNQSAGNSFFLRSAIWQAKFWHK